MVDDDESVRQALPDLLRVVGFAACAFSSAKAFLLSGCVDQTRCLILDIAMPGMSGPELQHELKLGQREIPIVFFTAQTDESISPRLLEQGAAGFRLKPSSDTALLAAISAALQVN